MLHLARAWDVPKPEVALAQSQATPPEGPVLSPITA